MKKVVAILVVALSLTSIVQAQKKGKRNFEKLSVEQKTTLAVKKMILKLDLTDNQARKIKPLIAEQVAEKKAIREKYKALKTKGKKPTANQRYAMQNERLDKQIAFKKEMKSILNEKQFEKFEKIAHRKMCKRKKGKRKNHKNS